MLLGKQELDKWLQYPSMAKILDWFTRRAGGKEWVSWHTIAQYVKDVRAFLKFNGYDDPEKFLADYRSKPASLINPVNAWIGDMSDKGKAPMTQIVRCAALRRWLRVNGVKVDWHQIVLPKKRYIITDKAPSKPELRKILMFSPLWVKAAVLVLATSGIRIGVLSNLKVKHLDLERDSQVGFLTIPPEMSKTRIGYFSFISEEARDMLKQHWAQREGRGEQIGPESPVIQGPNSTEGPNYFSISTAYRRTLRRSGLTDKSKDRYILHAHTLRKWFRTRLEGIMTRSQIERLMGHYNTEYLDGSYFRPPEKDLSDAYRRAIPNLTILEDVESEEFQKQLLLKQASIFLTEEKLRTLKDILARAKTFDEVAEEFRRLGDNHRGESKIIEGEAELLRYTEEGWNVVKELNGDKYLVRLE